MEFKDFVIVALLVVFCLQRLLIKALIKDNLELERLIGEEMGRCVKFSKRILELKTELEKCQAIKN